MIDKITKQMYSKNMIPLFFNTITAGFPSPATDYIESELDFNKFLVQNKAATFAARAQGDSMINAGIFPGDIIIIDRSITPKSNDIIIASLDKEFTVKRLIKNGNRIFLHPENSSYEDIEVFIDSDFQVWGVVTFTIHKLYGDKNAYCLN
ncbi:MAG: translesion error-prone DNA polymerase V autoproteolytic subunit [Spirochaetales bacterium]|nr:translesion error-prone DNA polymerase V autoproteolytic subunit [Spirochaetales bacterium]